MEVTVGRINYLSNRGQKTLCVKDERNKALLSIDKIVYRVSSGTVHLPVAAVRVFPLL